MPKAIVVISDMEIDYCGNRNWSFYDKMANKFHKAGYVIPNIIFWNVKEDMTYFMRIQKKRRSTCKWSVGNSFQTNLTESWIQSN